MVIYNYNWKVCFLLLVAEYDSKTISLTPLKSSDFRAHSCILHYLKKDSSFIQKVKMTSAEMRLATQGQRLCPLTR